MMKSLMLLTPVKAAIDLPCRQTYGYARFRLERGKIGPWEQGVFVQSARRMVVKKACNLTIHIVRLIPRIVGYEITKTYAIRNADHGSAVDAWPVLGPRNPRDVSGKRPSCIHHHSNDDLSH